MTPNHPIVNFHRIYKADAVDRVVLWSSEKRRMWFPKLIKVPAPNQFGCDVAIYNGQIPLSEVNGGQLLALGGEHTTTYRLGDLMSQASDIEVVRGLRALGTNTLEDCIIINAPKIFSQCIAEPDPTLAKLGWSFPILMEYVEKPKVEQPSQLLERGFDPSEECIHFSGKVNWRLSPTIIDKWEQFLDIQVKIYLYTSYLLEDMKLDTSIPKREDARQKWVKK